jgi:hypothetical protein
LALKRSRCQRFGGTSETHALPRQNLIYGRKL